MLERKIVYLPHPVTAEVKKKHLAAGERIIDIRFAPKDYVTLPGTVTTIAEPENVVLEVQAAPKQRGRPRISK
jgi:hypothetical protein